VASGRIPSVRAAADALVSVADTVEPDLALTATGSSRESTPPARRCSPSFFKEEPYED